MSIFDSTNNYPKIITFSSQGLDLTGDKGFQSIPVDLGVNEYDSVVVIDAEIPKSFYNFPAGYNSFTLTEIMVSVQIEIPARSYNKNNLLTTLSSVLTSASPHGYVYVASYSPPNEGDSFHIYFTVTGNAGVQPVFSMWSDSRSPFRQLGFNDDSMNVFSGNQLESVNCINLSLVSVCYLQSNIVTNSPNGILQQFLNIGQYPPLSMIYFQQINYDLNTKNFNQSNTNSWFFTLVDDLFLPIDTNGIAFSFTLGFSKRSTTHELHKADLYIQNEQRKFEIEQKQNELKDYVKDIGGEIVEGNTNIEPNSSTILSQFIEPKIKYPS